MKAVIVLLILWSIIGMAYLWHRIGIELETEAMIDPAEYHTNLHYIAYGPIWWGIIITCRILIFLLRVFS